MRDLLAVMWKEAAEFGGNRRFLRIFAVAVLAIGILPTISLAHTSANGSLGVVRVLYVLFATAVVVAQTAPDLVLHERVGHTLDYLLTTPLPVLAIFGAKVLIAAAVGYLAALSSIAVQLITASLIGGTGWHWLFLAQPSGRVLAFAMPAAVSLYVAVVGTFVALRVGEQRAAYMVTVLLVGILGVPFLLGWLQFSMIPGWLSLAACIIGAASVILGFIGSRLFHRDRLVLYLQE